MKGVKIEKYECDLIGTPHMYIYIERERGI